MITARTLIAKIKKYNPNCNEEPIIKAYEIAKNAHSSQTRSSGEPYFSHPIAVAQILIDLKLDSASIITALMHDTVEDTDVTLDYIKHELSEEIALLVDGVTKLTKIESLPSSKRAAENFRKLVMAMSQDIRVLLVKLADRLHNMRTIEFISSSAKRSRIANESLIIYAPLAARIGMYQIRDELQELSFEQINPAERQYITERLKGLKKKRRNSITKVVNNLKTKISKDIKNFEIQGREKKPYSIWNKMRQKNVSFYHLYDIMAFRIIVDDPLLCYKALGIINSNYQMIPGSFKDYISTPKENGYKSIHLIALGPDNKKIEIQIRTQEMHKIAEYGVAAHWSYKQKTKLNSEESQYKWIRDLIGLFEHASDASEVLQNHKIQMHKDQVFCFTPNGDVFNLQNGATIIDFAYAVHSEVGDSCVSAKVNGETAPLRQKLENGDQIEIMTSKKSRPSLNWLQFVTTSKAKTAIRHFIRIEKQEEYKKLGKAIINKFFAKKDLDINEILLEKVANILNKKSVNELYILIAQGILSRNEILKIIYPNFKEKIDKTNKISNKYKDEVPIEGLISGMAMNFGSCCNPIPGDEIIGIINTGSGVTIHNKPCRNMKNIAANSQMILEVCWNDDIKQKDLYKARIKILLKNQSGALADVSSAMFKRNININNIDINNRNKEFFEIVLDVEVKNSKHLDSLILSLRILDKIIEVERY
ncbi:bifunctional (p)ppGpp synthetase/guanosine-3',5'-bis(diphosphate) 3'-pyrophosphohydrolase [Rickettsiales bacterium]|nr:bifunctional (p)ppGpp synthetase/guanosine-3',5'-bis(diphosphate) 3'-pyrophosphohydrolase [Rickettsiales bacterium]